MQVSMIVSLALFVSIIAAQPAWTTNGENVGDHRAPKSVADVKQFGAVGDGLVDDTPAIQKSLESGAGTVYFPTGTYKVTAQLTVPRNVHVFGDGVDASVVTAQGADPKKLGRGVFYFGGEGFSPMRGLELAANVRRFDREIAVKSTAGLEPDDLIVIIDPRHSSYSAFRTVYNAGEFVHAGDVSKNKITVVGLVQADYRKEEVQLHRMVNPTRSSIRGLTIIGTKHPGDDTTSCLHFWCGRGVAVRDVRLLGAHYALCQFSQCFGAQAENVEGDQIFSCDSLSGQNYGIMIANSQDVRIVNCRLTAMRHAIAIGGSAYSELNPNPVNRQISVSNCDLKATCNVQALDAHGNTESYTFENNRVHGGIDFGGMRGRIIGNDIYGRNNGQVGIALYASEWKGTEFEIRSNRIHTVTTTAYGEAAAIYLAAQPQTVVSGSTIIANNSVFVAGNIGNCRSLRAINYGSDADWILIVDHNVFHAVDSGHHMVVEVRRSSRPLQAIIARNNTFRNGDEIINEDAVRELVFTGNWPRPDRIWSVSGSSK